MSDEIVVVRRHWDDWRRATVRRSSLGGLRMDRVSGGVGRVSPYPMVYGYIWCDQIIDGELVHSCEHGPPPHEIKVVVVEDDNTRKLMKLIILSLYTLNLEKDIQLPCTSFTFESLYCLAFTAFTGAPHGWRPMAGDTRYR